MRVLMSLEALECSLADASLFAARLPAGTRIGVSGPEKSAKHAHGSSKFLAGGAAQIIAAHSSTIGQL